MTVQKFLNMFMVGCSSIDEVSIFKNGKPYKVLSRRDVLYDEFFGCAIEKVLTFEIHGNWMTINVDPKN